ncbi:Chaperone required for the assembly of the mitochondrial F1-ATPase [Rhodospirillaceae bacterium LM-1]|nr:Chaperone required for the assembly of the mitochondrial F1-ATPase [Rhodospirillaceae bacterium LM-1]
MTKLRKRFYKEAAAGSADGGFTVLLDDRPLRTPKGHPLILPTLALAEAIASEWKAQGERIEPETMPQMQVAATAIDRVAAERAAMHESLMRYCETDLLCYRAAHPADLAKRQAETWQPVLDWAALNLDAPLMMTEGLAPIEQPAQALKAIGAQLERYDHWRFTALSVTASASGSLLLALALVEGHLDASGVIAASQLDESYQQELWGADEEAQERQQALAQEIKAAWRFITLI